VLKLPGRLPLPERTHVTVTIDSLAVRGQDMGRNAWLKLNEEALTVTWDNPADDVFNELLQK
jgi:hypothetical protein